MTNIKAIQYLPHIEKQHAIMTGESLAFLNVGCPTCDSKLVKRNKKGTDTMFIACDKTNRPYCPFSIGLNETLLERTIRLYNKLKHKEIFDMKLKDDLPPISLTDRSNINFIDSLRSLEI